MSTRKKDSGEKMLQPKHHGLRLFYGGAAGNAAGGHGAAAQAGADEPKQDRRQARMGYSGPERRRKIQELHPEELRRKAS
jgi:hypothetical protein